MSAQAAVVVTFYSRCGTTETLALAAAVGAVQGRALIRLRRLPDEGASPSLGDECDAALTRMQKEYVPPTEADVLGNPALILVPSAGATPESKEWVEFAALLARLGSEGRLAGKIGAVVDSGSDATVQSFASLLERAGFRLAGQDGAPTSGDLSRSATTTGRSVAAAAQAG